MGLVRDDLEVSRATRECCVYPLKAIGFLDSGEDLELEKVCFHTSVCILTDPSHTDGKDKMVAGSVRLS